MNAAGLGPAEQRLAALGFTLPDTPPPPAAAYLPHVQAGSLVFTAGQIAVRDGTLIAAGTVGDTVDLDTARACARQCAVNVLAQCKAAVVDLARVQQVVKLTVFVASAPSFIQQHLVADAASELLAEVFGEHGRHARSAVGAARLPLDSPVEIEAVIEVA